MKNLIIRFLQYILGFKTYLFLFSIYTYFKLPWDRKEKDFLMLIKLIKEDGIILDIGANIGVMTSHFAKKRKKSNIYSFEPIPHNLATLKRVISFFKLKNVSVFDFALSNTEGKFEMIMPIINGTKKHGLCKVKHTQSQNYNDFEEFEVSMKKLDDLAETSTYKNKKIVAIKIDVEGHELKVLRGAENTLKKHMPVIYCELWPGKEKNNTINYLASLNYNCKVLEKEQLVSYKNQTTQNFFFTSN